MENKTAKQEHPLVKFFDFSLSKKDFDDEVQKKLNDLAKKSKIQGFRPGKTPLSVIRSRYGENVKWETVEHLAKEVIDNKLKNQEGKIASRVSYNEVQPLDTVIDGDYKFTARYEVYPDFEFNFDKCEVVKNPQIEIDEKAMGQMLEWLKLVYGKEEKAQDGMAIAVGNRVIIDMAMESQDKDKDGNPEKLLVLNKYSFVVPINKPEAYLDFPATPLIGKKVGEEVVWKHRYEEDFANPIIAGSEITLRATILEIFQHKLLSEDELYLKLGLKDKEPQARLDDIRRQISSQLEKRQKQVLLSRISKSLVDGHKFEVPPTMLEEELMKIGQNLKIHPVLLKNSEDPKHKVLWEKMNNRGVTNVSTSIIWKKISESMPEKVKNEEVLAQVKKISEEFERSEEVYKNLMKDQKTLMRAYEEVHQDKIINWLKSQMKFADEKKDFAEFMIG